jgi:hypothetical protein
MQSSARQLSTDFAKCAHPPKIGHFVKLHRCKFQRALAEDRSIHTITALLPYKIQASTPSPCF